MSLYAEYIKEREKSEILETDFGFASFKLLGKECFIRDVYVKPEYRRSGVTRAFISNIEIIARQNSCEFLSCSVAPYSAGAMVSLKSVLSLGFEICRSDINQVYFVKRLK